MHTVNGTTMPGLKFELFRASSLPAGNEQGEPPLPWQPGESHRLPTALALGQQDGARWFKLDSDGGVFVPVDGPCLDGLGFQVLPGRPAAALAMFTERDDVLVNALPALRFSVLKPKDTLTLGSPGHFFYVTLRFTPYIGPPPAEILGRRCPVCKIPIQAGGAGQPETRVITCRCGSTLHWETPQSHPGVPESELLNCAERSQSCPSCQHELSNHEVLLWDPNWL